MTEHILTNKDLTDKIHKASDTEEESCVFENCNITCTISYICTPCEIKFKNCNIEALIIEHLHAPAIVFVNCNIGHLNVEFAHVYDTTFNNSTVNLFTINSTKIVDYMYFIGESLQVEHIYCHNTTFRDIRTIDLTDATRRDIEAQLRGSYPSACPEEGSFIAYKKAYGDDKATAFLIVSLRIPSDAKRVNPIGSRKCRCDKAEVIDIVDLDGNHCDKARSGYDENFLYIKGEKVSVDDLDEDPLTECSRGIHFFLTAGEALRY